MLKGYPRCGIFQASTQMKSKPGKTGNCQDGQAIYKTRKLYYKLLFKGNRQMQQGRMISGDGDLNPICTLPLKDTIRWTWPRTPQSTTVERDLESEMPSKNRYIHLDIGSQCHSHRRQSQTKRVGRPHVLPLLRLRGRISGPSIVELPIYSGGLEVQASPLDEPCNPSSKATLSLHPLAECVSCLP